MLKQFIKYASSNVLGMLGLSCYILADTFFIAQAMGANGLTALNLSIPVYSLMHGVGLLLGMGGGTKYAVLQGEGKRKDACSLFTRMLQLTLAISFALMLLGGLGANAITRLVQADAQVFGMTKVYIQVILLFAPGFMLNDVLNCFVRNDGAPGLAMAAMLTSSFSNILLDYVLMFPLGMGIFGAVLATGLASVLGVLLLTVHFVRRKGQLRLRHAIAPLKQALRALALGVPALVGEWSSGVVMLAFNSIILRLTGNVGVAAYGVIANLSLVALAMFSGLAQGAQPLVSYAKGMGNRENMRRVLRYEMTAVVLISLAVGVLVYGFPAQITAIFNSEKSQSLQMLAETGLKLYFSGAVFAGYNIVLSAFFAAAERERPSQIISVLRGFALMLPVTFALSSFFGMNGVWLSFPVTEACVALLGVWLQRRDRSAL